MRACEPERSNNMTCGLRQNAARVMLVREIGVGWSCRSVRVCCEGEVSVWCGWCRLQQCEGGGKMDMSSECHLSVSACAVQGVRGVVE